MTTSYPGGLDTFTNPTASDTLASVPHHTQHGNANDAIAAIEAELGTSPKGSYGSVKARLDALPVYPLTGTDGSVSAPTYSFASDTNTGVYSYTADALAFATGGITNLVLDLTGYGSTSKLSQLGSIAIGTALTASSATTATEITAGTGTKVFTTASGHKYYGFRSVGTVRVNDSGAFTELAGLWFAPVIQNTSGTGTITALYGANIATQLSTVGTSLTVTAHDGVRIALNNTNGANATVTAQTNLHMVAAGVGTGVTTLRGLWIESLPTGATTTRAISVGDYSSQHIGRIGLGGASDTTAPVYQLDLQGTGQDRGVLAFAESTATPTNPTASAQALLYMKADKLVIGYLDGATMRYKYLDLTGTGVTWTHTTSAP